MEAGYRGCCLRLQENRLPVIVSHSLSTPVLPIALGLDTAKGELLKNHGSTDTRGRLTPPKAAAIQGPPTELGPVTEFSSLEGSLAGKKDPGSSEGSLFRTG
jgi:hypothetical protein